MAILPDTSEFFKERNERIEKEKFEKLAAELEKRIFPAQEPVKEPGKELGKEPTIRPSEYNSYSGYDYSYILRRATDMFYFTWDKTVDIYYIANDLSTVLKDALVNWNILSRSNLSESDKQSIQQSRDIYFREREIRNKVRERDNIIRTNWNRDNSRVDFVEEICKTWSTDSKNALETKYLDVMDWRPEDTSDFEKYLEWNAKAGASKFEGISQLCTDLKCNDNLYSQPITDMSEYTNYITKLKDEITNVRLQRDVCKVDLSFAKERQQTMKEIGFIKNTPTNIGIPEMIAGETTLLQRETQRISNNVEALADTLQNLINGVIGKENQIGQKANRVIDETIDIIKTTKFQNLDFWIFVTLPYQISNENSRLWKGTIPLHPVVRYMSAAFLYMIYGLLYYKLIELALNLLQLIHHGYKKRKEEENEYWEKNNSRETKAKKRNKKKRQKHEDEQDEEKNMIDDILGLILKGLNKVSPYKIPFWFAKSLFIRGGAIKTNVSRLDSLKQPLELEIKKPKTLKLKSRRRPFKSFKKFSDKILISVGFLVVAGLTLESTEIHSSKTDRKRALVSPTFDLSKVKNTSGKIIKAGDNILVISPESLSKKEFIVDLEENQTEEKTKLIENQTEEKTKLIENQTEEKPKLIENQTEEKPKSIKKRRKRAPRVENYSDFVKRIEREEGPYPESSEDEIIDYRPKIYNTAIRVKNGD